VIIVAKGEGCIIDSDTRKIREQFAVSVWDVFSVPALEATEIHGRWRIVGTRDSGAFLMVRATRTAEASVSQARSKEPVR
jgi:hypothetical protein